MRIIFYILLALGLIGLIRSIIHLFKIGGTSSNVYLEILTSDNRRASAAYHEMVSQAADSLIFIVGAVLFLFLL